MRSYLTKRQNRVKLNSAVSEWIEVKRGRPQGSSFKPLLWNIFQNDLTDLIGETSLSMYADDHQLHHVAADSTAQVEQSLNIEGEIISRWHRERFLQGNYNKYSAMIMSTKKVNNPIFNVNIDDESGESKPSFSLLGVTLDGRLSYSAHISDVCKKAGKNFGVLTRLRNLSSKKCLSYNCLNQQLPNPTYCHTVWHFCKAVDTRKMERVQERALRAVSNNKTVAYEQLLNGQIYRVWKISRLQDIFILMYKVKYNLVPKSISDIFCKYDKKCNLRNVDLPNPRYSTVSYARLSKILTSEFFNGFKESKAKLTFFFCRCL